MVGGGASPEAVGEDATLEEDVEWSYESPLEEGRLVLGACLSDGKADDRRVHDAGEAVPRGDAPTSSITCQVFRWRSD